MLMSSDIISLLSRSIVFRLFYVCALIFKTVESISLNNQRYHRTECGQRELICHQCHVEWEWLGVFHLWRGRRHRQWWHSCYHQGSRGVWCADSGYCHQALWLGRMTELIGVGSGKTRSKDAASAAVPSLLLGVTINCATFPPMAWLELLSWWLLFDMICDG